MTDWTFSSGQGSREWGGVRAVVGERLHALRACLWWRGTGSGGLVLTQVLGPAAACQRLDSSL